MLNSESLNNANAVKYAFALAIKQHLVEYASGLSAKASDESEDETTRLQYMDTVSTLEQLLSFVFPKIITHYKEEDLKINNDVSDSLVFNMTGLFLRPVSSIYAQPNDLKTEDVIKAVESDSDDIPRLYKISESDELLISSKFLLLMRNTIQIYRPSLSDNDSDLLSIFSGKYLEQVRTTFSEQLGFSNILSERIGNVARSLDSSPSASIEVLYDFFKRQLFSHIELLSFNTSSLSNLDFVSTLREQGNNLMSSQAIAQAIKVYTTALDSTSFSSLIHVPQLLTNRAIAFIGLNCFPEAISDLVQAVDFDRTFTPAWTQLGYCHLYMGTSLIALKCYLFALKSSVGQLYPAASFKSNEDLLNYKSMKSNSVSPQFIQRLTQSIILTERRANQQRESPSEIQNVVGEVRRILAGLRVNADDDTRAYFTYSNNILNDHSTRSVARRTNRSRPNILNPDVSQNILANNGMESVTVATTSRNPLEGLESDVTMNNDNNAEPRRSPTNTGTAEDVRGFLNDFGDLFERRGENEARSATGTPGAATEARTEPTRTNENPVRDVLRGILPSVGNIFSSSLRGENTVVINGQRQEPRNASSQDETPAPTNEERRQRSEGEDIDMPQIPEDLD